MPVPFPASRENQVGRVSDTRGRRGSPEDFRAVHGVSAREPLGGTNGDAFRGGRASGNVLSIITRDETCQRRSCRLCLMRIDFRIAFPREPGITDTLVLSRDLWWPPGPAATRYQICRMRPGRRPARQPRRPQHAEPGSPASPQSQGAPGEAKSGCHTGTSCEGEASV